MTLLQSILLGIIQGLTEFLPVSSSAHLVIVPYLFGWQIPAQVAFAFDVLVQVATLVAVVAYFWKDLVMIGRAWILGLIKRRPFAEPSARLGWLLILGTIPAGLFGLLARDAIESAFTSPVATALFLLVTAGLMVIAEHLGQRTRSLESLTWLDSLWVGVFQALSVFPGISRSGATISGGMLRNVERPAAARYSFLLSIPIMLAAGLLAGLDLIKIPSFTTYLPVFIPGFLAAAVTGYLVIRWLLRYLAHRPLTVFSIYCFCLSLLTLAVTAWRA
jgi:undecaprenyl-diphosphatase